MRHVVTHRTILGKGVRGQGRPIRSTSHGIQPASQPASRSDDDEWCVACMWSWSVACLIIPRQSTHSPRPHRDQSLLEPDEPSPPDPFRALAKWTAYYSAVDSEGQVVRPPWESGKPASCVMALVEEGALWWWMHSVDWTVESIEPAAARNG